MSSLIGKHKLFLLFLFAFLIRLIHLDQSLWLDEATTVMAVKTFGFFEIITQFSPSDFHPPLYYLVMKFWTGIFGYSEVALRMPSVLFSLGAGWVIYKIMMIYDLRFKNAVGFWATAFFLFNPLIIYYSQEARMYSMVTFTIAVSFYYFLKIIKSSSKNGATKDFWLMNVFLILSFMTFYASIFYIMTVYLYLLWKREWRLMILSGLVVGVGMMLMAPLLFEQYTGSRESLVSVKNWSLVLGKVTLKNLFLFPIKFTSGRISFYPKMLYYALAGGWLGLVSLPLIKLQLRTSEVSKKYYFFLVMPLILGTLFSFNSPLLQYFRFQYLIVFLSIGIGLSCCHSKQSEESRKYMDPSSAYGGFRMTRFLLLIGFVSWSLLYLVFPQFHREDWKSLADVLKNEKAPIYMILSSSDPLKYYAPEIQARSLKNISIQGGDNTIVIVPYTADIHGVDYKQTLETNGYFHEDSFSVRGLSYEKWTLGDVAN